MRREKWIWQSKKERETHMVRDQSDKSLIKIKSPDKYQHRPIDTQIDKYKYGQTDRHTDLQRKIHSQVDTQKEL